MARLRLGTPEVEPSSELDRALAFVRGYEPPTEDQVAHRDRLLAFCAEHPDALHRTCLAGHLTASAIVLDAAGTHGLFTLHKKLGKWLQLGGHCDGDANLPAVALREAWEESGLSDLTVDPEVIRVDVHTIPVYRDVPEHLHLDVSFAVHAPRAAADSAPVVSEESHDLAWLSLEEARTRGLEPNVLAMFARAVGAA